MLLAFVTIICGSSLLPEMFFMPRNTRFPRSCFLMVRCAIAVCLSNFTYCLYADVSMPSVFADHMVLQQATDANIWGWATPGEQIRVTGSWNENQEVETVADADGNWSVKLETPTAQEAAGPQTLTISAGNVVTFNDVLIGEVWILSGQSNMSIPLTGWDDAPIQGGTEAIAAANYPNLRLMVVGEYSASEEQSDIHPFWDSNLRQWAVCTPTTVRYFSALGYFFGKQMVELMGDTPIGLLQCAWAGSSCEAWLSKEDLAYVENYRGEGPWTSLSSSDNWTPSVNWNGMLNPIIPYSMKGVLWYQGESNMGRAEELTQLFPQMIEGWRREWGQGDFPFCFAQLAPWSEYWPGQEPELWEAQASTLFLPNTGMVVTVDLVDADELDNIHPKRKAPIAGRMVRWALANAYGHSDVAFSGPVYDSMVVEGDAIRLSFDDAESGLMAKEGQLQWFEIAGEDEVFYPADAIIDGSTVVIRSAEVSVPTQARYAWSKVASGDLFNQKGLPAAPFRTQPADYLVSHQGKKIVPEDLGACFFTSQGHLMDPMGTKVKGYGVNMLVSDYDVSTGPVAANLLSVVREVSGGNMVRIVWNTNAKENVAVSAARLDVILAACIEQQMIPVLSFNDLTGISDSQMLRALAAQWMQSEYLAVFQKYEESLLLDVSAGWSGTDLTDWHDTFYDLITILRSYGGGIRCPLLIEAANAGKDLTSIQLLGTSLLDHDAMGNLLFAVELDGASEDVDLTLERLGDLHASRTPLLVTRLKAMQASSGNETETDGEVVVSIEQQMKTLAEAGIGYLAWVWCGDQIDGPLNNLTSEQDWQTLTLWGETVVEGDYGVRSLASVAPSLVPEPVVVQE